MRVLFNYQVAPRPFAVALVRSELRSAAARGGVDDAVLDTFILLTSELVSNAIEHAQHRSSSWPAAAVSRCSSPSPIIRRRHP